MTQSMGSSVRAKRQLKYRHYCVLLVKLALTFLLLYWLIDSGRLDFDEYHVLFSRSNVWLLGAIFATQTVAFMFFVVRWWGLVRVHGIPIRFSEVMRTGFQGLFTQLFVPGGIGQDGLRILYLKNHYPGNMANGVSSVLMDRVTGLISLLVLGLGASLAYWMLTDDDRLNVLFALNAILLIAALCGVVLGTGLVRLPGIDRLGRIEILGRTMNAFRVYGNNKTGLMLSIVLSLIGHILTGMTWCLCLIALDGDLPVVGVVAISSITNVIAMLPLTPMGLGITDGVADGLFDLIGISTGAELQMFVRLVSMFICLLAGTAFFRSTTKKGHT